MKSSITTGKFNFPKEVHGDMVGIRKDVADLIIDSTTKVVERLVTASGRSRINMDVKKGFYHNDDEPDELISAFSIVVLTGIPKTVNVIFYLKKPEWIWQNQN